MESLQSLNDLLHRPDIWRGRRAVHTGEVRDTGFTELNEILVGGGWPLGGLVEIHHDQPGSGEWQLLSGVLANFAEQPGYLVLVNPPALLYASALAQMGVPAERILVIRSRHKSDLLASVLEVLKADCASLVLFWEGRYRLRYAELRKVQLSVAESDALCFMLSNQPQSSASPAPLRLELQPQSSGFHVRVDRQRGGFESAEVELAWPAGWTLQPCDRRAQEEEKTPGKVLPFSAEG